MMELKLLGIAALLLCIGAVGIVSAVDLPINVELQPALSIDVVSTIPSPWQLTRSTNVLTDVISITTSNDIPALLRGSGANDGLLTGTKGTLTDQIRLTSPAFIFRTTPATIATLTEGSRTTVYSTSQPIEPADKPGAYSGTITFVIEAA